MKQYRFDYIKDSVEKWTPNIPRTLELIEGLPLGVEWYTFTDQYGEKIEDIGDWIRQRHEYCVKLAKEYERV